VELQQRGDRLGLVAHHKDGTPKFLPFVWMDWDRRYFIISCSSLAEGSLYVCNRWRQLVNNLTTPPEKVELTIPQPITPEMYYSAAGKTDQHNRDQQATLAIETKLKTHNWSMRVNISILCMCVVDTWRAVTR
jgi:hypothetical protein